MSFEKKKLKSSLPSNRATNVKTIYENIKRKNAFLGTFLGTLSILFIAYVGLAFLSRASDFSFHLPLPSIPLLGFHSESDAPETGKINILITWVGGGVHDGADLTDSIIVASINKGTNTVSMLSLPRDLYVEFPTGGRGKLNETYFRAYKYYLRTGRSMIVKKTTASKSASEESDEKLQPGNKTSEEDLEASARDKGMKELANKITEITGEKIDMYASIDFRGFEKFVDILGGIEVDVPDDLVDTQYPDNNWGYQTFRVKKWLQTMDGSTALKYARSRHSTSDFDRSLRQQAIVRSIKEKLFSLGTLSSPSKIQSLYDAIASHILTNLSFSDMISLAIFSRSLPTNHILSFNLNDSCFQSVSICERGGFLYTPARELFGDLSVLLPSGATPGRIDHYEDVRKFGDMVFNSPGMFLENHEINIINATKYSWIANSEALELKKFGFNIPEKNSIGTTKDSYSVSTAFITWDAISKTGVDPSSETVTRLKEFFPKLDTTASGAIVSTPKYSKSPTPKIELILGKDFSKR